MDVPAGMMRLKWVQGGDSHSTRRKGMAVQAVRDLGTWDEGEDWKSSVGTGGRRCNQRGRVGGTLGRITLTSIIITANVHAAQPTPVKVHRCTCVYTCTGTYTHTHTHKVLTWKYFLVVIGLPLPPPPRTPPIRVSVRVLSPNRYKAVGTQELYCGSLPGIQE